MLCSYVQVAYNTKETDNNNKRKPHVSACLLCLLPSRCYNRSQTHRRALCYTTVLFQVIVIQGCIIPISNYISQCHIFLLLLQVLPSEQSLWDGCAFHFIPLLVDANLQLVQLGRAPFLLRLPVFFLLPCILWCFVMKFSPTKRKKKP